MQYCRRCVMPDTRPGIMFDSNGICQACKAEDQKDHTDWKARFSELKALCDKYRGIKGNFYDCVIAVSGGKDSHYQTHILKEKMSMNPLLITVEDNLPMTEAGVHNLKNISESFGCDVISLKPNIQIQKRIMRKTFEKYGKPTWYIDRLIYTFPIHMAVRFNIQLVVYGENVNYEYGGTQRMESYSAKEQIQNGVASDIPWEELLDDYITPKELALCDPPSEYEQQNLDLNPIYLSYFVRWNSFSNYLFAKKRGFHDLTHEWRRSHHVEDFDQLDSRAYLVHSWMKYPKYGHASATDYCSKFIRYNLMSRDEAIALVKKHDHNLDNLAVRDFCHFMGYSIQEFWDIVDNFYNRDLFIKNSLGEWQLKNPIWDRRSS